MRVGDFFCGAGGASTGMMRAGHEVVFAVNHSPDAIAAHRQNHKGTVHFNEDVREIDPYMLRDTYPVDAVWWSAECTHLSNAKGGSSRDADSRMLSEHLVWYAEVNRWGRIYVENVKEIRTWGPLVPKPVKPTPPHSKQRKLELEYCDVQMRLMEAICTHDLGAQAGIKAKLDGIISQLDFHDNYKRDKGELVLWPEPTRRGTMYDRWITHMVRLGYRHEWRVLNYSNYGGAQRRERYFAIFHHSTCHDDIKWPKPTHAKPDDEGVVPGGLQAWRLAKDVLDLDDIGHSIFSDKVGQKAKGGKRLPLSQSTLNRIADGIAVHGPKTMIDRYHSGSVPAGLDEPLPTVMASMDRGVVKVSMVDNYAHDAPLASIDDPLNTLMASKEKSLVAAFIVPSSFNNHPSSLLAPLPTLLASRKHMSLATCSFIANEYSQGGQVNGLDEPLPAVMTVPKSRLTTAFLIKYHGTGRNIVGLEEPISTCTTKDRLAVVNVGFLVQQRTANGDDMRTKSFGDVLPTVTTSHFPAVIQADVLPGLPLTKYVLRHKPKPTANGNIIHPSWCRIVSHYLVDNRIADVNYRLLKPSEGMRAQGFPDNYFLGVPATKAKWMIGNAVPVEMGEVITKADGFVSEPAKLAV